MKKIKSTLIVCLVITIVFALTMFIVSKIKKNNKGEEVVTEADSIAELENLFQNKDYEAITGKVRTENLYEGKYGKYYEIADIYYYYSLSKQYINLLNSEPGITEAEKTVYIEYGLNYGFIAINMSKSYTDNGIGEENALVLQEIGLEATNTLKSGLKITDEEIQQCLDSKDAEIIGKIAKNVYNSFS